MSGLSSPDGVTRSTGRGVEKRPVVSVLMNCLNGEQYLREALDSVMGQTFHDWEIVFWDNASTDGSGSLAQSYGEKVRYFRAAETSSLGKARELAVRQARGRYIAILDCDDFWHPTKLEEQVALMEREPEAALCYTDAVWTEESGKPVGVKSYHRAFHSGYIYEQLILDDFITCSSAMFLANVLSVVGGFDKRWDYVEELDLWLRIGSKFKVACVPKPLTYVRLHANNASRNFVETYREYRQLIEGIQSDEDSIRRACLSKLKEIELRMVFMSRLAKPTVGPVNSFKNVTLEGFIASFKM